MNKTTNGTIKMNDATKKTWPQRMDTACLISGSLVPCGIATGNIAFELLIALTCAFWIARLIIARENPFPSAIKHPLALPWICWFGVIMASLIVNGPGNKGWMHDIVFIRYLLFMMAIMDVSRRRMVIKYLIYGLGVGVIWGALNTLFAYAVGFDFLGRDVTRYALKLKEASRISAFSAYASTFFLSWGIFDKEISRKTRGMILGIALIAMFLLFQTHIRTSVLAAGFGMIFMMGYIGRKKFGIPMTILNVLLACSLTGIFLFAGKIIFTAHSPASPFDLHHLSSYKPNLNSLYARFQIWKVTWAMWLDNPVFGVGISSFQDVYRETAATLFSGLSAATHISSDMIEQTHAHNLFLMLASSTGILGVAAFGWLFINAIRLILKNSAGHRVGLMAWPAVIFVMGLTGFNIYHSWYLALFTYLMVLIACDGEDGGERIVWQKKT